MNIIMLNLRLASKMMSLAVNKEYVFYHEALDSLCIVSSNWRDYLVIYGNGFTYLGEL